MSFQAQFPCSSWGDKPTSQAEMRNHNPSDLHHFPLTIFLLLLNVFANSLPKFELRSRQLFASVRSGKVIKSILNLILLKKTSTGGTNPGIKRLFGLTETIEAEHDFANAQTILPALKMFYLPL